MVSPRPPTIEPSGTPLFRNSTHAFFRRRFRELNSHEVLNAVDQANRELQTRFDFKNTKAVFELDELTVKMKAEVEFQLKQMLDILRVRLSEARHRPACASTRRIR